MKLLKKEILNEIKAILGPPRQNYKILILNLFGLQIIRYILSYVKYNFLSKTKKFQNNFINDLNENGYVIIKNFFSKKDFQEITDICNSIEEHKLYTEKKYGDKKVLSYDFFLYNDNKFKNSKIIDLFRRISFFNEILELIKVNNQSRIKNISFEKIVTPDDFIDMGDIDAEWHADRFYPCIKIFYYLNDNSIENGAFQYLDKSHKFSIKRLIHEYIYSILICYPKLFSKICHIFGYKYKNNRFTFTDKKLDELYGKKSVVHAEASKNSLIIVNNKGFHKRGIFKSNKIRSHLRINLYDLQISKLKSNILDFAKKQYRKNLNG